MVDVGINIDALQSGLKAVRALRSTVLEVFKFLGDGATAAYGDEEREKFINEVQATLANVKVRMRQLNVEGEKMSANVVAGDSIIAEIEKLITEENLNLEQIYNSDETGLYWKALPEKTLALVHETSAP
ncbi:hypothetical protein AVEN_98095-1 [Araneus ventricosus]|uniref:Uncharacterized protein n=1 Tax=Araneus ventricosus TaxID=182803 RepID=A0A4Y2L8Z5_ARAVE|nr:hypothetical protein AVEN_98095-1 [Araneus ventricosus]